MVNSQIAPQIEGGEGINPSMVTTSSTHCCVVIQEPAPSFQVSMPENPIALSLMSPILIILGWFVVAKIQSNRERRKQIREFVADLLDRLGNLEALVIDYHTSERDQSKEHEVISQLTRFEKSCASIENFVSRQFFFPAIKKRLLNIDAKKIQVLRSAMTLNHFFDSHTSPILHDSDLIQELELAVFEVIEKLGQIQIDALD